MSTTPTAGRRERKKAATRASISEAALRLFLARGYAEVSLREIADAADVAVATVFKHFPGKEALVFDEDHDIESALVAAVVERPAGSSVLDALEDYLLGTRAARAADPDFEAFKDLVARTPELRAYWRTMWVRHSDALAAAIAASDGSAGSPGAGPVAVGGPVAAQALARFVLETADLASGSADPSQVIREAFTLLRHGWRG